MTLAAALVDPPVLPRRSGARPRTTLVNPHQQLEDNAPAALQQALIDRVTSWPGVQLGESWISHGSRAFVLDAAFAGSDRDAFLGPTLEFAHVHPIDDGSLHAKLPPAIGEAAMTAGWAEPHPMARRAGPPISNYMLYGPRDAAELEVIVELVERSYRYALREGAAGPEARP